MPVPAARVPYALALSFAWLSELWADRVTGRAAEGDGDGCAAGKANHALRLAATDHELGVPEAADPRVSRRAGRVAARDRACSSVTLRTRRSYGQNGSPKSTNLDRIADEALLALSVADCVKFLTFPGFGGLQFWKAILSRGWIEFLVRSRILRSVNA